MDKDLEKNLSCRNVLSVELVAAYVRVSTTEQKLHGLSLDAQKMKLTEYAEKHNMKIIEWYVDEGVSARKLIKNRPELQRMIQDAEKGKFERIIFIKLDRFFRSVAEYHECMKRISPVVWTTTEEEYDLTTANGRMLVNMKLTIAEMEADMAGERVDIVNEYKVSTGQPISGSQPFGFTIGTNKDTGKKNVIKDPDVSDILDDMIAYFLRFQSKRKTVLYANTKYHLGITHKSLSALFRNPMLYGFYRGNPNYCEAYVDQETFDRMQFILTERNIRHNSENRVYYFTGLIKCPSCGRTLKGTVTTTRRKDGSLYYLKKYRCTFHRIDGRCEFNKVVSENVFQRMMLADIEKYLKDAKLRSVTITDAEKVQVPQHDIEEIYERIDRLNYSWNTGKIRTVEKYEKDYAELMELLEEAEAERKEVIVKDFSKIERVLMGDWRDLYNNLNDDRKRAFWRSFIHSIEINWTTQKKEITRVNFFDPSALC